MIVRNHMTHDPVTVTPETFVARAQELFGKHRFRCLPVTDDAGSLVGVLTERQAWSAPREAACLEVMSPDPVAVRQDASLVVALRLLCERHHTALPVVSGSGKLVGVITRRDLLCATSQLLGLDRPGRCVELAVIDGVSDALKAFETLHKLGVEPYSVIVGRARDDGDEPALYLRVPERSARQVEHHLCRAGLVLLVPENGEPAAGAAALIPFNGEHGQQQLSGTHAHAMPDYPGYTLAPCSQIPEPVES